MADTPQQANKTNRPPRRDARNPAGAPREESPFEEYVISIDRVARVVKGGRRFRFKALVVVGDRKSRVGVGVAKGQDVQLAVSKATDIAKKTMVTIPLENDTIPHDVEVKFSGARVMLRPASPGTGVIAGGPVRAIIGVTGMRNLLSKSLGSNNKVNIAYATIEAIRQLKPRSEWVGNQHGKKKAVKTDKASKVEVAPAPKVEAAEVK